MTGAELWRAKLEQLFHDPFLKAWCQGETAKVIARDLAQAVLDSEEVPEILWESFAQDKVAALLSRLLLGEEVVVPDKAVRWKQGKALAEELEAGVLPAVLAPDLAASGADRPVLGTQHNVYVRLWQPGQTSFVVTHPLDSESLHIPAPASEQALLEKLRPAADLLQQLGKLLPGEGEERYRKAWYLAWRRLPEELAHRDGAFWPLQPADTRCPDHSIWDHLRVTSSLAFIPPWSQAADERVKGGNRGRRPWLLALWVGPARDFVGQARTGRDLWAGSMLLAELAWSLIEPVVKQLGPDAVLYPDLRANLRADLWIAEQDELGETVLGDRPDGSRASLIPNRLVAVVPEELLDGLAEACLASARSRWRAMTEWVRGYLAAKAGGTSWQAIFDEQVEQGPALRLSAVRWDWDGRPSVKREEVHLDPAVPFQEGAHALPGALREIENARAKRYTPPWLDREIWNHYQAARQTALMTHPGYLLGQRGFDYPLVHHQLLALDAARSRMGQPAGRPEPGEKCTLCGARQALSDRSDGTVSQQREAARQLWRRLGDEGDGAERLCGPCAVRRFLSDTDDPMKGLWWNTVNPSERRGTHSIPFPSTGLIAGQKWLAKICERHAEGEVALRSAVHRVLEAFARTGIGETQFAGALPRLRRLLHRGVGSDLEGFLRIDIQYLAPERWDALEASGQVAKNPARDMREACRNLRTTAGSGPETHIAVLSLDGDRMGRLLLGDPEQVRACWRDVLHPEAVEAIRSGDAPWKVFWRSTLERPRLLGPSTHAFVTRALRHFANRILPWVVEREYGGRLIYAGGDDALALCPAAEALSLLARLNELFTAPWVLDRRPEAVPWPAEELGEPLYDVGGHEAEKRFEPWPLDHPPQGRVVPMLGRHQSFSAGVALGHYKTSLRVLRNEAIAGRDRAKKEGGRRAGLSWFTRNGVKLRWTAPLSKEDGSVEEIQKLASRFAAERSSDRLPGRLPYKLREDLPAAIAVFEAPDCDDDVRASLLAGLVGRALDEADRDHPRVKEVTATWRAGLTPRGVLSEPDRSLDGLLLARALAGLEQP